MTRSRRCFLRGTVSAAVVLGSAGLLRPVLAATAPFGPADKFDLVVKGGDILDPSQSLRARRDIGIRNAVIAAIEPDIPAERAKQILDVQGKLVTPGLIDFHSHVFHHAGIGLRADELVPHTCTTTYLDAGYAGVGSVSAFMIALRGTTSFSASRYATSE